MPDDLFGDRSVTYAAQQEVVDQDSAGAAVAEADIAAGGDRAGTFNRPNRRLAQTRQAFTAAGVFKSKAKPTFDFHQRNNVRFVLYLFDYHLQYLKEDLAHELYDAAADPDYSSVEASHPVYQRRGGKKSIDERKRDYRDYLLRGIIFNYLGQPEAQLHRG